MLNPARRKMQNIELKWPFIHKFVCGTHKTWPSITCFGTNRTLKGCLFLIFLFVSFVWLCTSIHRFSLCMCVCVWVYIAPLNNLKYWKNKTTPLHRFRKQDLLFIKVCCRVLLLRTFFHFSNIDLLIVPSNIVLLYFSNILHNSVIFRLQNRPENYIFIDNQY